VATDRAGLPELGQVNNKEIAALVGTAPFNRDSGTMRGAARSWGTSGGPPGALYGHTDGDALQPHDSCLLPAAAGPGKAKKVALVAGMRKLLVHLNTMIENQTPWRLATD